MAGGKKRATSNKRTEALKKQRKAREKSEKARQERMVQVAKAKAAEREKKKKEQEEEEYSEEFDDEDDDDDLDDDATLSKQQIQNSKPRQKNKRSAADDENEDEVTDPEADLKKQLAALQRENNRLQCRNLIAKGGNGMRKKKGKKGGTDTAMHREVKKNAQTDLWQKCKHIRNERYLNKATRFLMDMMDIASFDGLEGKALQDAQDLWVENWQETVRKGVNFQRNYALGEIRDYMVAQIAAGNEDKLPNKENVVQLALRQGMDERGEDGELTAEAKKLYKLMVPYWDALLPKVCGKDHWCATKRHYGLTSTMRPPATRDDPNPDPFVDESAEALLVLAFENAYDRWKVQARYAKLNEGKKKEEADSGWMDPLRRNEDGKFVEEDVDTKCTTATSGQAKYGGLTKEGRDRLQELQEQIKQNREENAEKINQVETTVLTMVRKLNRRDKIDERRKKRRKKVVPVPDPMEEDDDEDPEDFSKW